MSPPMEARNWHRQLETGSYLCSTNPEYLQVDVINAAFTSDMLWWARALPVQSMKTMLDNCLCLGIYKLGEGQGDASSSGRTMIGFARVITDYVTFGYLTDVFVLAEHQGRGLGRWLLECLNEVLESWPELRGFILLASDPHAIKLYAETLGTKDMRDGDSKSLFVLEKAGPAQQRDHLKGH